jgi:rSAM/selenodomain-associated transferase 2/rSAM/selenodomain-associated transferase 1
MAEQRRRLILFARFPAVGKVKTRLIPALGAEGATALHRRLVLRTLRTAQAMCQSGNVELEIRFAGGSETEMRHWLGVGGLCRRQCDGDLGQRMAEALADSFREGSPASVIIGSDCPALTPLVLAAAFDLLKTSPVVFGPATDGGYYLIGQTKLVSELFHGVDWGTEHVLAQSLKILDQIGIRSAQLEGLDDLDRPEDLATWQRILATEETAFSRVSVIIPALNEAAKITDTLESVNAGRPHEVILVDGGSTDGTPDIAKQLGALILKSPPGRARQMNAGAASATGEILLFLHADTQLPPDWIQPVTRSLQKPGVAAGAFRFKISGTFPGKSLVEGTTNWRSRRLQNPYGDQGVFMRRALFEALGGYADMPIMEDFDLVRRLRRRGRVDTLEEAATTSGRRWQALGVFRTTLVNHAVVTGYHLGVSPAKLARLYRGSR